jgi:hypothetical protein
MERTGMNVLFAYNRNGSNDLPFTASIIDLYKRDIRNLLGIVYNYESQSQMSVIDGLPVGTLLALSDPGSSATALAGVSQSWDGKSPLFVAGGVESWNMAPTDVNTLVNSLGSEFEVVRGDVFFELFRAANGLPASNS